MSLAPDGKDNLLVLLELQGDMHLDWLFVNHQGTYPHNLTKTQDTSLLPHYTSHGPINGDTCHFQIGDPRHHRLSFDHMIGQEKLVAVKGRAEPLREEIRDVVLHQRM